MKKIAILVISIFIAHSAIAATSDEEQKNVQSFVNSAVAFFQDKGQDYSIKAFNALHGPFVKGPLYVFLGTLDGRILAHPFSKALLEKNQLGLTDSNGKLFFKEMISTVENQGEGWVDYVWPYPGSQKIMKKRCFVKRIPSQDTWIGAGFYIE